MPKIKIPILRKPALPFPTISQLTGFITIECSDDETPRKALGRMLLTSNHTEREFIQYAMSYLEKNGTLDYFDRSKHEQEGSLIIKNADPTPPENIAEWIRRGYPVQLKVEIFIDGKWVDITEYVKQTENDHK